MSSDADLTDDQILELWTMASQAFHEHAPSRCGEAPCKYRALNREECDSLADEWLTRHPLTGSTSTTPAPGAPPTP